MAKMVKTQDLSQTKAKGKIRFSFLFEIKLIPNYIVSDWQNDGICRWNFSGLKLQVFKHTT